MFTRWDTGSIKAPHSSFNKENGCSFTSLCSTCSQFDDLAILKITHRAQTKGWLCLWQSPTVLRPTDHHHLDPHELFPSIWNQIRHSGSQNCPQTLGSKPNGTEKDVLPNKLRLCQQHLSSPGVINTTATTLNMMAAMWRWWRRWAEEAHAHSVIVDGCFSVTLPCAGGPLPGVRGWVMPQPRSLMSLPINKAYIAYMKTAFLSVFLFFLFFL